MIRTTAMAAAFLALAATLPTPQAKAQETLGGAIGGAILGGAIGGAVPGRAGRAPPRLLLLAGPLLLPLYDRRVHAGPARLLLLLLTENRRRRTGNYLSFVCRPSSIVRRLTPMRARTSRGTP